MKRMKLQKAIFFDRDGTINNDEGHYYIYRKEDFIFNPGIIEGMKRLVDAGYLLFVITNQGGIAKGIYTREDTQKLHDYMCEALEQNGVHITKIYYCPHHESIKTCICRKPSPYMINMAIEEFNLDRSKSFLIGDGLRDVKAAEEARVHPFKIHKNQNITSIVNTILKVEGRKINMNMDEADF